jgi:hypothetical protein
VDQRPGAHRARFNGGKQLAVAQPVIAKIPPGLAQRDDFRVRGRIVVGERAVPAASDDAVVADDDRAHGHFARFQRALR